MDVFQYSPITLDRPALRLVRLRAACAGPEINCDFIEAFFDEDYVPDYEAISYTWGSLRTPEEIQLNGSKFAVTENLLSVLQDVRYEDEDRILWIDAICINQGSHSELGHQVQQMDQIYRRAHRVIIWLGPLTEQIRPLMDALADLDRQLPGIHWPPTDHRWQLNRHRLKDSSAEALASLAQAFRVILERPWFRRVWVIQEVANARAALVHCGPKSVTARVFAACPNLLDIQSNLDIKGKERNVYAHCQAILDVMPGPSRRVSWWNQDRDLWTLLKKFSNTEATREHDKVFALLGLCPDANAEIPVDYTQPIDELTRKVVLHMRAYDDKYRESIQYPTVENLIEALDSLLYPILGSILRNSEPSIIEAFILKHKDQLAFTEGLVLAAVANTHHARYCVDAVIGLYRGSKKEISHAARALPKIVSHGSAASVEALLQCNPHCDTGFWDETGYTALTKASTLGNLAIVKLLLDRGAGCNRKNASFLTPLECAIENGKEDVVLLLLARGADLPQETNALRTMLAQAIERGQKGTARHSIDAGAWVEGVSSDCSTALALATYGGYKDIVELLLERGADCNHMDLAGNTPVMAALIRGHESIVRLLCHKGADLNHRDREGNTPVMAASIRGHAATVRLLCDKGADCNLRNTFDETPMMQAAQLGHTAVVELLLERGVDFETKHRFRETPLSLAQAMRHHDIVRLFERERSKRDGAVNTEEGMSQVCSPMMRLEIDPGSKDADSKED